MQAPTLNDLLQAGAYFGHKKELSHPKAQKFIFNIKDGVNIINLEETINQLQKAVTMIDKAISENKQILFVGTKDSAKAIIESVATDTKMPYVNSRWLGGTLTNYSTIRKRIDNYIALEKELAGPEAKKYIKKEKVRLEKELARDDKFFKGLKELKAMPGLLFVIDPNEEHVAVAEAQKLHIPVAAICNTNTNMDKIDCPIPANDNAVKSLKLIGDYIAEKIKEKTNKKA